MRSVVVTNHAIGRLRARRPRYVDVGAKAIAEVISREVVDALAAGRVADEKPPSFRLHRERGRVHREDQKVVWTASGDLAWIVVFEGETVVAITTLTRAQPA